MYVEREYLDDGGLVITHFILFSTRWLSVRLNRIHRAEGPAYMHDHGASYLSLILWGGYTESIDGRGAVRRLVGSVALRRATTRHYIARVGRGCLTLVIGGPRCNVWQFYPVGNEHKEPNRR